MYISTKELIIYSTLSIPFVIVTFYCSHIKYYHIILNRSYMKIKNKLILILFTYNLTILDIKFYLFIIIINLIIGYLIIWTMMKNWWMRSNVTLNIGSGIKTTSTGLTCLPPTSLRSWYISSVDYLFTSYLLYNRYHQGWFGGSKEPMPSQNKYLLL